MLTFFRRILFSRIGVVVTLIFLVMIGLAFGLADVTGLRSTALNGGGSGTTLVTVGKRTITATETQADVERMINMYRQQYPQLTMEEFIAKGGLDQPLENRVNSMVLDQFGQSQGMRIGKALADSEIASQFKGLDGKFSEDTYKQYLSQARRSDADVRAEIARTMMAQLIMTPFSDRSIGQPLAPNGIASPYATMLAEKRTGTVAFIDTKKMPTGAAPTDAEVTAYYKANLARYMVPERRSVRYATVTVADLRAKSAPTDAEIAKAYGEQAARFAPSETRSLRQVVLLDQKSADALAAKVRGGTAIDVAAKAVGLDAATLADQTKAALTAQTSAAVADQVFGAADGAVIGPVKTGLGWAVIHLDKITKVPGKTLAQAKPDLVKELTDQKTALAASALRAQIDDATANGLSFDDIAKKLGLTIQSTPPLDAQGNDPDAKTAPPAQPDPVRAALMQVAFQAAPEDDPQFVPIGKDGSAALVKLDKVVAAGPRPLATIAEDVKKNLLTDRQLKQARVVATAIRDKVNKGMKLSQAMAESGVSLDPTKPITGERRMLVGTQRPPAPFILLFNTAQGTAKMLEAPYKGGWFVLVTDSVQGGQANPDETKRLRGFLGAQAGDEYSQQFVRAVRTKIGVKRNDAAIAALREQLLGKGGAPDDAQQ